MKQFSLLLFLFATPLFIFSQQISVVTQLESNINETSGLLFLNGKTITHNDSGGQAALYEIDVTTGNVNRTVTVTNATNVDWEDITQDGNYIYVGDFGNNNGSRKNLKIYKISIQEYLNTPDEKVTAEVINFNYSDQTDFTSSQYSTNFDAEALIAYKDHLYIFSKNWGDQKTNIYEVPKDPGTYTVDKIDTINTNGLITGADFNPLTHKIVLTGYSLIFPFVVELFDYSEGLFSNGTVKKYSASNLGGNSFQIEGVAAIDKLNYYISGEKNDYGKPALYKLTVLDDAQPPVETQLEININFQNAATSVPENYLADTGSAYSEKDNGYTYGWLTKDDLQPVDLSKNTRNRTLGSLSTLDNTLLHMQYGDTGGTSGTASEGIWEIDIATGFYEVQVTAGDGTIDGPGSTPSHTINAEGVNVIYNYVPSGSPGSSTRFKTGKAIVSVTDGKLTIDAEGGFNTKIDYLTIKKVAEPAPVPEIASAFVNFATATDTPPDGYMTDSGLGFADQGNGASYGWLNKATLQPVDLSKNTRNRNKIGVSALKNTLLHMQYDDVGGSSGVTTEGVWEIALQDGFYEVEVGVGDAAIDGAGTTPSHTINVEGINLINSFVPSGAAGSTTRFATGTTTVEVLDGRLTIDAEGGFNTKINYINVIPVDAPAPTPEVSWAMINFSLSTDSAPDGYLVDSGLGFATRENGAAYGWLSKENLLPLDLSKNTRNRNKNGLSLLENTLLHMQYNNVGGASGTATEGIWEIQVANGTYQVEVSVGDAAIDGPGTTPSHTINAEGVNLINAYVPYGAAGSETRFKTATKTVEVNDGRLTVDAEGGFNTKINYIKISPADATTKEQLAVSEFTPALNNIKLYPNPASSYLDISYANAKELLTSVVIYDLKGQKILSFSPQSYSANRTYSIPLDGLSDGVYVIQASFKNTMVFTKKLIVANR